MKNEEISVRVINIFSDVPSSNIQSDNANNSSEIKQSTNKNKSNFPKIDINIGLNNNQLQSNSVLIHRLLQKRLIGDLNKNMQKFIKILVNEMNSKTNKYDIDIITRDTLLEYYIK